MAGVIASFIAGVIASFIAGVIAGVTVGVTADVIADAIAGFKMPPEARLQRHWPSTATPSTKSIPGVIAGETSWAQSPIVQVPR